MLYQIHHQNKKDRSKTEFCSQREIETPEDFRKWFEDVKKNMPPPNGFEWLFCNEKSAYFMKTTEVNA